MGEDDGEYHPTKVFGGGDFGVDDRGVGKAPLCRHFGGDPPAKVLGEGPPAKVFWQR